MATDRSSIRGRPSRPATPPAGPTACEILQRVAENLKARHPIQDTILVTKPDSSFPADPADVEMLAADATAIIAAIGD